MMLSNLRSMCLLLTVVITSCEKFVEIEPPATELIRSTVFESDATAVSAMASVYSQMIAVNNYSSGSNTSLSFLAAISADEIDLTSTVKSTKEFYDNLILSANVTLTNSLWVGPYQQIYKVNAILEGLEASSAVSQTLRRQLEGEAKFARAFAFFYLVNLFGDVPLPLTTDYEVTSKIGRSSSGEVYKQIIIDLKSSIDLLDPTYSQSKQERVRPNKFAAKALLARVYLYQGDWVSAEAVSSEVINNTDLYSLEATDKVFLKNSREAIWQLVRDNNNTYEAITYIISGSSPTNGVLRPSFLNIFDSKDKRFVTWVGKKVVGSNTYYYPNKYRALGVSSLTEYSMVLRLAELYLIRAEARINQPGKIGDGVADLNTLRVRASQTAPNNLSLLSMTLTKEDAMRALETERKLELFSEWGHRWMDLKRWPSGVSPGDNTVRKADDVLGSIKQGWKKEWKLYPIPQIQIQNDPAMSNSQNPGYN